MTTFRYALMSLANRVGGSDGHAIRRMTWREQIHLTISADGRLRFAETDFGYGYSLEPDDLDADDWVLCPLPRPPIPDPASAGLTFAEAVAHLRAHPEDTVRRAAWEDAVAEPGVPFYGFISVDDGTVYYHDRDGDAHLEMDDAFTHVLATDWEIVPHAPDPAPAPEPPKTTGLTLAEAVKIAEVGGYIRRPCFKKSRMRLMGEGASIVITEEDAVATDWEIVPAAKTPPTGEDAPKTTGLTFRDAVNVAGVGGRIRRPVTIEEIRKYKVGENHKEKIFTIYHDSIFVVCLEDILATDWEVVP